MKVSELLNEEPKKPGIFKRAFRATDKFMNDPSNFMNRAISTMQATTGKPGPNVTKLDKKKPEKTTKKKSKPQNTNLDKLNASNMPSVAIFRTPPNNQGRYQVYSWDPVQKQWNGNTDDGKTLKPLDVKQGVKLYNQTKDPKMKDASESIKVTGNVLKEGGNIFKKDGEPVTQRIKRDDIDTTLDWVEKITGIDHKDMKLGSTGIKADSGDIDVAVNAKEVDKEEMYQKLVRWAQLNHPDDDARQWVAKSGTNVHFKAPINGKEENGFAQLDLMFGDPEWMKFALKGSGDGTPYKGADRMIMLASISKAQGYKWSPTNGLVDRETNQSVTKNPVEIAKAIIGPNAQPKDLDSVETIVAAIKNRPDYEDLVADVKDNFAKRGLSLPESNEIINAFRRIQEI